MTPAINLIKKAKVFFKVHEYERDSSVKSYGLEAAEKLGVEHSRIFKTLVAELDGRSLVVAVIPVVSKLNMKLLAKAAGGKKANLAEKSVVERSTGYVLGGVSPLGQKKPLKTLIDVTAKNYPSIYISAGRRGLEVELAPVDLANMVGGNFVELSEPSKIDD